MIELKEGEILSSIGNRFRTLFKYMQYNSTINIDSTNSFSILIDSVLAHNIKEDGIYPFVKKIEAVLSIASENLVTVRAGNHSKLKSITIHSSNCYKLAKMLREVDVDFERYITNQKTTPYKYYLPLVDKRNIAIDNILND